MTKLVLSRDRSSLEMNPVVTLDQKQDMHYTCGDTTRTKGNVILPCLSSSQNSRNSKKYRGLWTQRKLNERWMLLIPVRVDAKNWYTCPQRIIQTPIQTMLLTKAIYEDSCGFPETFKMANELEWLVTFSTSLNKTLCSLARQDKSQGELLL